MISRYIKFLFKKKIVVTQPILFQLKKQNDNNDVFYPNLVIHSETKLVEKRKGEGVCGGKIDAWGQYCVFGK